MVEASVECVEKCTQQINGLFGYFGEGALNITTQPRTVGGRGLRGEAKGRLLIENQTAELEKEFLAQDRCSSKW